MWESWARVTRFLRSAQIAFSREKHLWETIELEDSASAVIHISDGATSYSVAIDMHISVMEDDQLLHAAVLIYSYAVAEGEASKRLGIEVTDIGGIEAWASRLLQQHGHDWEAVFGGKAGLVEVAVVRNVLAHGSDSIDERSLNRLEAAGCGEWELGEQIDLDFERLRIYRDRIRSLFRVTDAWEEIAVAVE